MTTGLTMFLYLVMLGSQSVIMAVRLSTGRPSIDNTRSIWGMKSVWARHHAFDGRTSGQAMGQLSLQQRYLLQDFKLLPGTSGPWAGGETSGLACAVGLQAWTQTQSVPWFSGYSQELVEQSAGFRTGQQVFYDPARLDSQEPPQSLSAFVR